VILRVLLVLSLLAAIAAASLGGWVQRVLAEPLPLTRPELIEVPPGATLRGTLAELSARGLVRSPRVLEYYGRATGTAARFQAGEYELTPGLSSRDLLEMLANGRVHRRRFVLVEGWRMSEVRAALALAPRLVQRLPMLDDAQLMAALHRPGVPAEGRFFPDTYDYTAGDTDVALLERALARMEEVLEEEWRSRLGGLPLEDPDDALVLASLVEKETGVPEDRERIAGVFTRRLERGMRLQTDPSVIYGLGGTFDGNLRRADLRDPHPWNTYVHRGLPPTPIAMPGRASIRAALRPAEGDALYFVARGDGTSEFSATLEAHNEAVRRFQLERRAPDYRSAPATRPKR
jgi:UPF0755 protein